MKPTVADYRTCNLLILRAPTAESPNVKPVFRGRRIGPELLLAAERWAREAGCHEMASDTWVDNLHSQRVHEALGFEVVDRCVHYRKRL